jgi:hypothetical protein
MKNIVKNTLILVCISCWSAWGQNNIIEEWNFTEDGSGLASKLSEKGTDTGFFADDPVPSDGGLTVSQAQGFPADLNFGTTYNDANTRQLIMSVTLSSFDFSAGTTNDAFGIRFRFDNPPNNANTTIGELAFRKQDGTGSIVLAGSGLPVGVALKSESGGPITYGLTLDFVADTYTYWIGTPASDGSTWVSRDASYTGSITGLGDSLTVDSMQWYIQNPSAGNQFVLDQVKITQVTP